MTFEEFKALALNPPYIDSPCVYRVDMHRYVKRFKDAKDVREFEVSTAVRNSVLTNIGLLMYFCV
jgi:hypothetical protein